MPSSIIRYGIRFPHTSLWDCGGAMFLAHTQENLDAPSRFIFRPGAALKLHHDSNPHGELCVKRFVPPETLDMSFSYLGMTPGECLIFSKRTLHMSDPRPLMKGERARRLALNVRVLIRNPKFGGKVHVWFGHGKFTTSEELQWLRKRWGNPTGTALVSISRFEMLLV